MQSSLKIRETNKFLYEEAQVHELITTTTLYRKRAVWSLSLERVGVSRKKITQPLCGVRANYVNERGLLATLSLFRFLSPRIRHHHHRTGAQASSVVAARDLPPAFCRAQRITIITPHCAAGNFFFFLFYSYFQAYKLCFHFFFLLEVALVFRMSHCF